MFLTWINEVIVKDYIVCWIYFSLFIMQLISSERVFLIFKFRLSPRLSIHLFVNNFRTFDFCRIIENEQIYLQTLIVNWNHNCRSKHYQGFHRGDKLNLGQINWLTIGYRCPGEQCGTWASLLLFSPCLSCCKLAFYCFEKKIVFEWLKLAKWSLISESSACMG